MQRPSAATIEQLTVPVGGVLYRFTIGALDCGEPVQTVSIRSYLFEVRNRTIIVLFYPSPATATGFDYKRATNRFAPNAAAEHLVILQDIACDLVSLLATIAVQRLRGNVANRDCSGRRPKGRRDAGREGARSVSNSAKPCTHIHAHVFRFIIYYYYYYYNHLTFLLPVFIVFNCRNVSIIKLYYTTH